jgi:DNA polymerase III delta prime subunit
MSFIEKHQPRNFSDLIFHDPNVKQTLTEYANGVRTKHLILHGPKGAGKSCAAQMIMKARLPNNYPDVTTQPFNGRVDSTRKNWEMISTNWSWHNCNSQRGFAHIDEVDRYNQVALEKLDEYLENTARGTIIMTTNHLENLDEWIIDRCKIVEVLRPTAADMAQRAWEILTEEGFSYNLNQVSSMLQGFNGSLRKMIEVLETHTLRNSQTGSQPSSTPTIQPALQPPLHPAPQSGNSNKIVLTPRQKSNFAGRSNSPSP